MGRAIKHTHGVVFPHRHRLDHYDGRLRSVRQVDKERTTRMHRRFMTHVSASFHCSGNTHSPAEKTSHKADRAKTTQPDPTNKPHHSVNTQRLSNTGGHAVCHFNTFKLLVDFTTNPQDTFTQYEKKNDYVKGNNNMLEEL